MIIGEGNLRNLYPHFDDKQFQPNGVDLRLKSVEEFSADYQVVGIINEEKYLPKTQVYIPKDNVYTLRKNTPYVINLGNVNIPDGYIGLFYLRSTFMRMGCLLSSSVADMGYSGTIKMLFYNPTQDVRIQQNERIVQMVLYTAETDSSYNGSYQENNWLIDEDVLIGVASDGLPITIFGKCELLDGYLYCGSPRQGLHRFVYEYYKGDIGEGYHIHHRNHNKLDDRIANLEKLTESEHRSHHNKGVYNPSVKNKNYDLPYGFTVKEKLENGEMYCFQYIGDDGVRRTILDKRFNELINKSINVLEDLKKDYSKEIKDIKDWAELHDLDIISFKRLEKNNLPKGCNLHRRNNKSPSYEFYHPSNKYLGGSCSFEKALNKAIENTDDDLYKSYLIKRWLNKDFKE